MEKKRDKKAVHLPKYIRCGYVKGHVITVGQTENGKFIIEIQAASEGEPEELANMEMDEKLFIGLFTAMTIYAEQYKIDLSKRFGELFQNDEIIYLHSPITNQQT